MLTTSLWSRILVLLLALGYCYPIDNTSTITPSRYITDPQSLTSPEGIFKLGFFNPGNSTNRYVGIWYNKVSVCTVVWVANNDKPIPNSSSGVLKIAEDGNLVVSDELGNVFWSTNVFNITTNNTFAQIMDTGNINLVQASDRSIIWQSFDHPQDNHLPGMQIGITETGKVLRVRSWKTQFDPSPGRFSSGIEFPDSPQFAIWNGSRTIWRTAPWNDKLSVSGIYIKRDAAKGGTYININSDTSSALVRFNLDPQGSGSILIWNKGRNEWISKFSTTKHDCDSYNKCGFFGSCNLTDSPTICNCIRGYEPKYKDEWNKRIWSSGCVRNTNFSCQTSEKERDKFFKLDNMKVPDLHNLLEGPSNVSECEKECVKNCSCSAYAYEDGIGCMSWDGNLVDIKKMPPSRGADLYIRLYLKEQGYEPKYKDEWNKRIWSSGCVRKTKFSCHTSERARDKFFKLDNMEVPDLHNVLDGPSSVSECEKECVKNCSCSAYAYEDGVGCMSWDGNLVDIKKMPPSRGADPYIRLYIEEQDQTKNSKNKVTISIILVLLGLLILGLCSYFSWRWIRKPRGKRKKDNENSLFHMDPDMLRHNQDIKLFKFEELEMATNSFSEANKLGEGGFGPVYKGVLSNGQEIAAKRLSYNSGQGLEEFKNEVVVILKLQHRNLVRLLGCCIEGDDNMLIYEYMPNKSLDFFIFDSTKQLLLDWRKRFQIIEGVCRGMLYLHRDSRLRVIHRDLKASNILLDEDLNPKISDFGMARIFGGNELQGNTSRVLGTHGYMSPEYAMEGRFSEKSDVFSFGVLLLEIISGIRNNSFYHMDAPLNILGYAWKLWRENKLQSFVDPTLLKGPDLEVEILRCIHVGLLCVQDLVSDRPSMSSTLSMLTSKTSTLPTPKQPTIIQTKQHPDSSSSQPYKQIYSGSNVTIMEVCGR